MERFEKEAKPSEEERMPDIEDAEEAREAIKGAIEKGEQPVISVPEEYGDAARNGITPHATWIGEKITAGTVLRPPYLPNGEKRRFFRINVSGEQIEPRFTGPDKHFHGVVGFRGPIPPDAIEEIKL